PNGNASGNTQKKYLNRRNITYRQALRYKELMDGTARQVCLKTFDFNGQAVYNGIKSAKSLTVVGTNSAFLAANAYTLDYGRNINDEDVALARQVLVVGK